MFNRELKQERNNLQYKCERLEESNRNLLQRINELKNEKKRDNS